MRAIMISLVCSALLGGCIGSDASNLAATSTSAAPPRSDAGTIEVQMVNSEQVPIQGAEVGILDLPQRASAKSDGSGNIRFTDVPAGEYRLVVHALGYEAHTQAVTVLAGDVASVTMTLEPIPLGTETVTELIIGSTYIACGANLVATALSNNNVCVFDDQHNAGFAFTASKVTARAVLQEVVWEPSSVTTDKFELDLWYNRVCAPGCTGEKEFGSVTGESPLRNYHKFKSFRPKEDPFSLDSVTFVAGGEHDLAVVFQQKLDHYITIFHNGEGSEDHTALPS